MISGTAMGKWNTRTAATTTELGKTTSVSIKEHLLSKMVMYTMALGRAIREKAKEK